MNMFSHWINEFLAGRTELFRQEQTMFQYAGSADETSLSVLAGSGAITAEVPAQAAIAVSIGSAVSVISTSS